MWPGSIASGKHRHGRWDPVLPVRSGIKTAIDGVVFTKFLATKKKSHLQNSKVKILLIAFFDKKGNIHKEFVPAGLTIMAAFYQAVLNRLLLRIRWVRPQFHRTGKWMLLHDNAPAHSAIRVRQFLAPLIWLLRTSSCFPAWMWPSKVHDLRTWMPSRIAWQPFCDRFHKRPLLIDSWSCTNVVKCVL